MQAYGEVLSGRAAGSAGVLIRGVRRICRTVRGAAGRRRVRRPGPTARERAPVCLHVVRAVEDLLARCARVDTAVVGLVELQGVRETVHLRLGDVSTQNRLPPDTYVQFMSEAALMGAAHTGTPMTWARTAGRDWLMRRRRFDTPCCAQTPPRTPPTQVLTSWADADVPRPDCGRWARW